MPSLIEDYVQALLNAAADSPIVNSSNIQLDKRANRSGLIRGDLFLGDRSRLYFRELVNIEDLVVRSMYSYQFKHDAAYRHSGKSIDPQHPDSGSFPHHKHIEQEDNVVASEPPTLVGVLEEIEKFFPLNNSPWTSSPTP